MFWKEGNGDTVDDLMNARGVEVSRSKRGLFNRWEAFILITIISSIKN